jgi:hypothetical protein
MELQKRIQVKRQQYEEYLKSMISNKAFKVGYSYNTESVFLWGDETVINQLRQLARTGV